jgi:dienelactone hydrolase
MIAIGGVESYVTGHKCPRALKSKLTIFVGYDIFGMSPNTKQFCDRLSKSVGAVVVMPDLLDNDPWPVSNLPVTRDGKFPKGVEPQDGGQAISQWVRTHRNCRLDRLDDIAAAKTHAEKEYGATKFAAVGMCWGAKVIFVAALKQPGLFDAIACVHGSFLEASELDALEVPVCLLNSKDEPSHYTSEFKPLLEPKHPANLVKLYPKMHHGWLGTRGTGSDNDFEGNKELVQGFNDGIDDLTEFYRKALAL